MKFFKKFFICFIACIVSISGLFLVGCDDDKKFEHALTIFKDADFKILSAKNLYDNLNEDGLWEVSASQVDEDTYNPFAAYNLYREDFLSFSDTDEYMDYFVAFQMYDFVYAIDDYKDFKFKTYYSVSPFALFRFLFMDDYIRVITHYDFSAYGTEMSGVEIIDFYHDDGEIEKIEDMSFTYSKESGEISYNLNYIQIIPSSNRFKRCFDSVTEIDIMYDSTLTKDLDNSSVSVYSEIHAKKYVGEVNLKVVEKADKIKKELDNVSLTDKEKLKLKTVDITTIASQMFY